MRRRIPWLSRFGMDRRRFLRVSAAGAAGIALIGCDDSPPTPDAGGTVTELTTPLIIGSGFGGSVSALRLAQSGIGATVLERGQRWVITDAGDTFCSMREQDERAAWMSRETHVGISVRVIRYAGLIEKFEGDNIDAIVGAAVGGGSLVYAGLMVKPPRDLFMSTYPSEISFDEMESTWYPLVQELLVGTSVPADILAHDNYAASRLFVQHAELAGLTIEENLVAIDWGLVRAELQGDIPSEASVGDYIYGLNSGAKGQMDRTYLAAAEATGMVDVRPLHQVTSIAADPMGGYLVAAERIDDHGNVLESITFRAPAVFLAAGSIHSTRLLVEARARGDLPMLSSEVGEGWGNNGQHIHMRNALGVSVPPNQGGPPPVIIRDLENPIAPVTVEHGAASWGYDCECMITPSSSLNDGFGALTWDPAAERTRLTWDLANGDSARAAGEDTTRRMNEATAGVNGPLLGRTRPTTFHSLGGVALGRAADTFGRVDGYQGLYVVCGAALPGVTPTANPAWTIAANAERCLATIIREDFA